MTEHDKAIWIKVEDGRKSEMEKISQFLQDSSLAERYEIIISDDAIETIDLDELKQYLDMNDEESGG